VQYNVACLLAVAGERDEPLALLERAVATGFGKLEWIEHDEDWRALSDEPRFQRALDVLRRRERPQLEGSAASS
jgi:hypothetical protein